jgi:hypothetical protein
VKTVQITISLFFFVCLFNAAFIPQLCLDAVQELQNKEVPNNILAEETTSGLNIFEEESKEASKENNEEENNHLNLKSLAIFNASFYNRQTESNLKHLFSYNLYQSISIFKITPPPKL